jgi:hypothetical protein
LAPVPAFQAPPTLRLKGIYTPKACRLTTRLRQRHQLP